jgi:hypothetical protein
MRQTLIPSLLEISRSYQLEMYEKSMKGNTIVVVCLSTHLKLATDRDPRWTLAVERHTCMMRSGAIVGSIMLIFCRAILRIMAEVEKSLSSKVRKHAESHHRSDSIAAHMVFGPYSGSL